MIEKKKKKDQDDEDDEDDEEGEADRQARIAAIHNPDAKIKNTNNKTVTRKTLNLQK